jgi:hypothetical protein
VAETLGLASPALGLEKKVVGSALLSAALAPPLLAPALGLVV